MKLISNTSEVSIMPPDFGYSVLVKMAFSMIELANKQFAYFDNGSQYDTTILKIPAMMLSRSESKLLADFLLNEIHGRTNTITLDLETDRGFFPAGPHNGDSGTFTLKLLNRDISEILDDPYLYFKHDFQFAISPNQAYSLPEMRSEGLLSILGLSGLRYPPEGFNSKNRHSYEAIEGYANNVSGIDSKTNIYKSNFNLVCNSANASNIAFRLLDTNYARTNTFTVYSQPNYYIFGIDNGTNEGDTYNVKLLKNEIEFTHENCDQWRIPVDVWMVP